MSETRLIRAKAIVVNALRREEGLKEGAIAIRGGMIHEFAPYQELRAKYPEAQVLGSDHHLALPGFVDAHNHGQGLTTFSQGLMDDKLEPHALSWPVLVDKPAELSYLDALLSAARQIRSGVTSTMPKRLDSPALPLPEYRAEVHQVIQAYRAAGMRLTYALGTTDKRSDLVYVDNQGFVDSLSDPARSAAQQLRRTKPSATLTEILTLIQDLHSEFSGTDMVSVAVAITGPQWISDDFLLPLAEISRTLRIPLHGPMLESIHQRLYAQHVLGHTVLEHLQQHGLLSERFSLAHGVWLTDVDMDLLAAVGGTVVHCPSSNLRFYGGIAPVKRMLSRGVNVSLAVDSEGINDDDDTFQEMRLASLLHRLPGPGRSPDPWDLLAMATINGARALGQQDQIGSLEPGKKADLVLIDLDRLSADYLAPSVSPIAALVFRAKPADIDLVMIDGEIVLREGRHVRVDFDQVRRALKEVMQTVDWAASLRRARLVEQLLPHVREYYARWEPEGLEPYYICNARM